MPFNAQVGFERLSRPDDRHQDHVESLSRLWSMREGAIIEDSRVNEEDVTVVHGRMEMEVAMEFENEEFDDVEYRTLMELDRRSQRNITMSRGRGRRTFHAFHS